MTKKMKFEEIHPKNVYVVVKLTKEGGFDKKACERMRKLVETDVAARLEVEPGDFTIEVKDTILEPCHGWPPGAPQGLVPIFKEY